MIKKQTNQIYHMYNTYFLESTQVAQINGSDTLAKTQISQIKLPGKFLEQILALPKDVLTPQEKLLYLRLFFFQTMNISSNGRYYAEVSLSHLAKEISAHSETILQLQKTLEEKGFIKKTRSCAQNGQNNRAKIEVSAPYWFKKTFSSFNETNKNDNLSKMLSKDLFVFLPLQKTKNIFKLKSPPSAKLLYLGLFLESYKNKVKNKKENLECFVHFTQLAKKLSLVERTVSHSIKLLEKEQVIKITRTFVCWKVELSSLEVKSLPKRVLQPPMEKILPSPDEILGYNRKRKIEKTRSEKIFKKNDFSVKKESKFSSQNYKFSESDVLFLQKAAERSFVKSEINEIFQKIQNKPFWSRVFFRSQKAFMNYMVKILKYEKTQEKNIEAREELKREKRKERRKELVSRTEGVLRQILDNLNEREWTRIPEYMLEDFHVSCRGKEVYFESEIKFYKRYFRENGLFTILENKLNTLGYKMFVA